MKRKLEDADDVFLGNPTKMLPTSKGTNSQNIIYQMVETTPEQVGRPIFTSTPHGNSDAVGRPCLLPTARRIPTTTFQSNPIADNELRHVIDNFVNVYEQLDKGDNPDIKPNYSYSELAYLALLRSKNFCLPIGQIYSYIQSRFQFFKNSTRKHWKNAVRHSLAKTMCFTKIQVGRGASNNQKLARSTYLWCILPNSIACFARGDYRATIDKESGTNTLRSAYFRMNSEAFWNSIGDYIANKMVLFRKTLEESATPGQIFESQTCSFPWKQEQTQCENRAPRREMFQSTQRPVEDTQSGFCRVSPQSDLPPVYYVAKSPNSNIGLPHTQSHILPNLHTHNAQARSTSPVLSMPEIQTYDKPSLIPRIMPTRVPDPWLPGCAVTNLEQSFLSESDRRSPPCSPFDCIDSGYFDRTNDNSCSFRNSCDKQTNDRHLTSPANEHYSVTSNQLSNDEYDFCQFDMSPFSLSDFSDLGDGITPPNITPEKAYRGHVISQTPRGAGQSMYVSTPISNQVPPVSQCRYMSQPSLQTQNYGQTATSTLAPVMFVSHDGMFSTSPLPHWASFC